MAAQFLLVPNQYPTGLNATQLRYTVQGQILPWDGTDAILKVTQVSLTSNVVTFTAVNALTAGGGQVVFVAGFTGALAFLNGSYTTTAATGTTFTASLTHANVPATLCAALATLAPNYATGGLAVAWFYDPRTGLQRGISGIGPLSQPKSISAYSLGGKLQQYSFNFTGTSILMLDSKGGTEATNAAAVPADSIGFTADWIKESF